MVRAVVDLENNGLISFSDTLGNSAAGGICNIETTFISSYARRESWDGGIMDGCH